MKVALCLFLTPVFVWASEPSCETLFILPVEKQEYYINALARFTHLCRPVPQPSSVLPVGAAVEVFSRKEPGLLRLFKVGPEKLQEIQNRIQNFQKFLSEQNMAYRKTYLFDVSRGQNLAALIKARYTASSEPQALVTFTPRGRVVWDLKGFSYLGFFQDWEEETLTDVEAQLHALNKALLQGGWHGFPVHLGLTSNGKVILIDPEGVILQSPERSETFDPDELVHRVRLAWRQSRL